MYYNVSTLLLNQISMTLETKKKECNIGARISIELFQRISEYTAAMEIPTGYLIRTALKEYIEAHPVPQTKKTNQEK